MAPKIVFGGEPPETSGPTGKVKAEVAEIVKALSERPGEWAVVYRDITVGVANTRRAALVKAGMEATVRRTDDGSVVWARCSAEAVAS